MGCPHFKRSNQNLSSTVPCDNIGTCEAHYDRVMIPSVAELDKFCSTEHYDECPIYLKYIERCTKADFPKIMVDLKDVNTR